MRPPKMIAGSVCLWLSRLLPGVGASFDFVGANERLSHTGITSRKRTPGVRAWSGKRMWRVGRVFPCRVYIDSNHCDSRI
jgi:hypothetical protein